MVNWYNVLIIVLFLSILTVLFIIYRLYIFTVPPANTHFCDIINKLETGDIFLVPYDSIYGHLVKIFRGCCWTHGSLIYKKDDGKIYIIEIARYEYKNKTYKGLLMLPLDKWLKFNDGRLIGYIKYRGNSPNNTIFERTFDKYKHVKVNLDTIYWMNTLVKWKYRKVKDKNIYFCTEFLAKFLQDLGMISKKYLPCSYSPITFSELKEYDKDILIFKNNCNIPNGLD